MLEHKFSSAHGRALAIVAVLGVGSLIVARQLGATPISVSSIDASTGASLPLPQESVVTARVSVCANGAQGDKDSAGPSLSQDGRYVAFVSWATNLVTGDTNGASDVFVKDRQSGAVVRVSVTAAGAEAGGPSFDPSISGDGHLVAFASNASNLVSEDTNRSSDVFVRDLTSGTTTRISVGAFGQAKGSSYGPHISSNGRYVAFASKAGNLVANDTNEQPDVFIRDLQTGALERVSVTYTGAQADGPSEGPSLSSDGRYVAFASAAGNLMSAEAGVDTNSVWDVFVRDRSTGTIARASLSSSGGQGNGHSWTPSISSDGRFVAFTSEASSLVTGDTNGCSDVFLRDLTETSTMRVSVGPGGAQGNKSSSHPAISGDGGLVAFYSHASNLVSNDANGAQDVFLFRISSGAVERASLGTLGAGGNGAGLWPSISEDGAYVAFPDTASNLAAGDTNASLDVFVRGPLQ